MTNSFESGELRLPLMTPYASRKTKKNRRLLIMNGKQLLN
nr:MAG TPA: hypothetical protein [Caudoviricetes sp.]